MADRAEYVMKTVEVKHIGKPHGPGRENPPHLWDFRRFVEACEGLPDNLVVAIIIGVSDDTGRKDVMFSVKQVEPVTDEMVNERANKLNWFKRSKEPDEYATNAGRSE
jgi:hypothetical protein